MEKIFDELQKNIDEVIEMVDEVQKALDETPEDEDQFEAAAKIAHIDMDNEMEPKDRLYATREDAQEENKVAIKLEEALEKKIEEMLDNG